MPASANPREVERQTGLVLDALELCDGRATFFVEGRLIDDLPKSLWKDIASRHRVACQGHAHRPVYRHDPVSFADDIRTGKRELEDTTGEEVIAYRAPDFSSEGCGAWFGEQLAEAGYRLDSSLRLEEPSEPFSGTLPLQGSNERVTEIPLMSVGWGGGKFLTIIGGAYLRVLPLATIRLLLERAESSGFLPMIYLNPYDMDANAPPIDVGEGRPWWTKAVEAVRRAGRDTVRDKLEALTYRYRFEPVESVLSDASS